MSNPVNLLHWILFGDFGLLTLTPRYLFLVLFPIMIFLGVFSRILPAIPFLQKKHALVNEFFYCLVGLGCTTAALASLDHIDDRKSRSRMIWILVLLVPCSSQLAIIATFASMVTTRVFFTYLAFFVFFVMAIYVIISRFLPLTDAMAPPPESHRGFSLPSIIKEAFLSIVDTIVPFSVGSIMVSLAMYFGILDWLCDVFGPFMDSFLHLPREATGLLILNILKRDFGSASLLSFAGNGSFDAVQLVVLMMMMTFCVPCFNSTILLFKQKRLPDAALIWLGSLFVSLLIGKIISTVFFICLL